MKKMISVMAVISSLVACAPEPQSSPVSDIQFEFGPTNSDVELDLSQVHDKTQASQNQWPQSKSLTAEEKLSFVENILAVGQAYNLVDLKEAAVSGVRFFRENYQPQTVNFQDSPYVEAIVGTTSKEAKQQISDAQKFLPEDEKKLEQFLKASQKTYSWPVAPSKYELSLVAAEAYIQFVINKLPTLELNPLVLEGLQAEIPVRAAKTLKQVREELKKVEAAQTSVDVLEKIQQMIVNLELTVSKETTSLLKQGMSLAKNNLAARDEQGILTVIVQIYRLLDPKDRKELIGSESSELYDFLSSASSSRLRCLETRGCKRDPVVWIGKKVKIFPQISTRGVANIRKQINTSMRSFILTKLDEEVLATIKTMPTMMSAEVSLAIKDKIAEITLIKTDFEAYVKKGALKWAGSKLAGTQGRVLGLEQLSSASGLGVSSSTLLGQAMMVKTKILNHESARLQSQEKIEWSLEHLNKLLALGGYKKNEIDSIRALAQPIDFQFRDVKLSLQEILKSKASFAVPDQISLVSAYASNPTSHDNFNVSVVGQARLLRGYSESIQFLKDWQFTAFDPILGQETLSEAFDNAPASVAQRKLFPKETLFALSVGNAAIILKNLLKDLTPLFVVGQESQIIWANNFDISSADAVSMAGVVNLMAGRRDLKVSASDLSEYMVALGEFVRSIEGLKNTQSRYLLEIGSDGKTNVDELIDAQKQVKILVVGLGNFLSHRMVSTKGWVQETYSIRLAQIEAGEMKVMTQFKAIESLLQAYEITRLTPYLWSALDLYYKLNKEVFNPQKGFYNGIETLEQGVQVIKILKSLQAYLPETSQLQLNSLLGSWTQLLQARLKI